MFLMVMISAIVALILLITTPLLLALIGAKGQAFDVAKVFLYITLPSNVLMALGMGFSGILRAVGDAKRAMWVTLLGGIVTAILDPIFIFGLNMGVEGAAIVVVISRLSFALVGFYGVKHVHDLIRWPVISRVRVDMMRMSAIAGPAILTNLATPIANVFIASTLARFGDQAVAASAVIDRLVVVAFGGLFALSGAVGPILSQNFGAKRFDRMRQIMKDSAFISCIYVGITWVVLILSRNVISDGFQAQGLTAELIIFFCWISGFMWLTLGLLFTANACFNNLGFPFQATAFNWGRATFGTIPFAIFGAWLMGAQGVYLGITLGAALFGISAFLVSYRLIHVLERKTLIHEQHT
jgi:Na+-driven multidrug efflux pump